MFFSNKQKKTPRYFSTDRVSFADGTIVDEKNGVIKNVSVCRVGTVKGHGVNIESEFIGDVVKLGNESEIGLKCRFGHPNMSNTALGTYMGRLKNFKEDGDNARADLHLDEVASKSPKGDLYNYILEMSAKSPEMFGLSIVFKQGRPYQYDKEGNRIEIDSDWDNYDGDKDLFATISELHACDCVDEPAANEGLYSAQMNSDKFAVIATQFLDENPKIYELLSEKPEIVSGFTQKYKAYMKDKKSPKKKKKTIITLAAQKVLKKWGLFKSYSDVETTEGLNLRISNDEGVDPAVGDEVRIIDEEGNATDPAPDGNHVVNGGDYDGYILMVGDGELTEVIPPDEESTDPPADGGEADPSLKARNSKQSLQLKKQEKELAALKKSNLELEDANKKLKASPAGDHTWVAPGKDTVGADEGGIDKTSWEKEANQLKIGDKSE